MFLDDIPFGRGATFVNGAYTIDSNNLPGPQYEGIIRMFPDLDYSTAGAKASRSNRMVTCMCVRNSSGITLLPRRLATLVNTGLQFLGRVDGYATTTAQYAYPIDEFLPSTGVVANDLFWLVIAGPALCLTDLAASTANVYSVGSLLVSLTAATSQATTAGRVSVNDLTGATSLLANQVMNRIGYALSAKTTNNTNASVLVDILRKI